MGSRIGSIAILLAIVLVVGAVALVINQLGLLNSNEPDTPLIVVSLDEDELLLLSEPQSITVTISSGSPIATLELFVDEVKVAEAIPQYSQERGAWIGSFLWTPERLGFATVRIAALDADGGEFFSQTRVEVTDDQARVAAALRVTVLGIAPLQQFPAGSSILLAISATGSQPIERFDMLVDGALLISVTPTLDENTGSFVANIEWTPSQTGEVDVTITAVDANGQTESQTISVILVPQAGSLPVTTPGEEEQETASEPPPPADEAADDGVGAARIESPADGQQFTLDANFTLSVQLAVTNVGTVASALLYLTPIAGNTLGNSVLFWSSEGHQDGDYRELVTGVEDFITSSGSYELQLVVFDPAENRYDDRITIHVVAVADSEGDSDQQPADDQEEPADEQSDLTDSPDLAIVTVRRADDNQNRVNVSITNLSTVDLEQTELSITVIDASSSAELGAATAIVDLEAGGQLTIPLDLDLQPGLSVEALVLLEASIDANTANNTFPISLTAAGEPDDAPPDQPDQSETPSDPDAPESGDEQEEQQEQQEQESEEPQPEEPAPSPDLAFHDAQFTGDGYVLLHIINNGGGPAETFHIVIADEAGAQLELINRAANSAPLGSGGTEILTSLQSHSGQITVTVVTEGGQPEQHLADNVISLTLP